MRGNGATDETTHFLGDSLGTAGTNGLEEMGNRCARSSHAARPFDVRKMARSHCSANLFL